ncbi:MAG: arylesterase [Betaproteobacteria bacterium]|nr:arylesterase [Betaproteobacteria bacterium]
MHFVLRRRDFNLQALITVWLGVLPLTNHAANHSKLLVVGDSLSAEYGIARGTGWVALLEAQLQRENPTWQVVNASISGETTAGGLARLPALLAQYRPQLVAIELGGNDALRGFSLQMTQDNLVKMIQACQQAKAQVLLIGMQVPPNYGARYATDFSQLFVRLSKAHQLPLVPFLLKGVADAKDPTAMFQSDRIHPLAHAHPIILANVWSVLKKIL